jgi:cell division protein FtsZ
VRAFAAPDAAIAQGIAYDDEMGDELRVTVVATGLGKNKASISLVQPQQVLHTGTYGSPMMSGAAPVAAGSVRMGSISTGAADAGMKQPAVWRREQASEQVRAMQNNGVETYDIPAFLRKQAD